MEKSYNIELDLHIYPEIIGSKGDLKFVEGKKKTRCRREEEQKGGKVGDASRAIG